jgi:hypothetical protein
MEHFGFQINLDLIKQGKCTWCKKLINFKDFKNKRSKKDFTLTGRCQSCQDKFSERRSMSEKGGISSETGGMGK